MKTKICTKCKIKKSLNEFSKDSSHKDGLCSVCKKCKKIYCQEYQQINKKKIKKQARIYNSKTNYSSQKKWYLKNKNRVQKWSKNRYKNNKIKIDKENKLWRKHHKKENSLYHKNYYFKNKIAIIKKTVKRLNKKYKSDINYKILCNLRSRINLALNNNSKAKRTLELLGCSINFFKQYLGKQFKEGMNWNNHSLRGWHIDHIKPCASFDLTDPKQQEQCFHYTNLQPLWWIDNIKKGCKL